jgi:hypothetical protein
MEWTGTRSLARNLRARRTIIQGALNRTLRAVGRVVTPALKGNTPRMTTKLANSTRFQLVGGPQAQQLEIRQGAKTPKGAFYGRFVREGTRAHDIVPIPPNKALRFVVGGQTVFRKRVHHPGTKPNAYHVRTLNQTRGAVQAIADREGANVAAEFARGKD